jgi:hypothetical protein
MELPPLIQIALKEKLWRQKSVRDLKEAVTSGGLDKEFSDQALWSVEEFEYADEGPHHGGLGVTPTGSLDPFSGTGKCFGEKCTAETVNDFLKSVGSIQNALLFPIH